MEQPHPFTVADIGPRIVIVSDGDLDLTSRFDDETPHALLLHSSPAANPEQDRGIFAGQLACDVVAVSAENRWLTELIGNKFCRNLAIRVPRRRAASHFALSGTLLRKVRPVREVVVGSERFLVFRRIKHLKPGARSFLDPRIGVAGLPRLISGLGSEAVLLRWHDHLNELDANDDLDLLVDDEQEAGIRELIESRPGFLPIDLYTRSGGSRGRLLGRPYYSRRLADRLLSEAGHAADGYRRPEGDLAFESLAYHATLHKGHGSGLPPSTGLEPLGEHPRIPPALAELARFARSPHLDEGLSLEGLYRELEAREVLPTLQDLQLLARRNSWLAERLRRGFPAPGEGSLAMFLLRDGSRDVVSASEAIGIMAPGRKFWRLHSFPLSTTERSRLATGARGGIWVEGGPADVAGGLPYHAVVLFDLDPERPTPGDAAEVQAIENKRFLQAKERLRKVVSARISSPSGLNPVHSTDSTRETEEHIREFLDPENRAVIENARSRIVEAVVSVPVADMRVQGHKNDANWGIREESGTRTFVKSFHPWAEAAFSASVAVHRALGGTVAPRLLRTGPMWIETEWLEPPAWITESRDVTFREFQQIRRLVSRAHRQGFQLRDVSPTNVRATAAGELRIIDLDEAEPVDPRTPMDRNHAEKAFVASHRWFTRSRPVCDDHILGRRWSWRYCRASHALEQVGRGLPERARSALRRTRSVASEHRHRAALLRLLWS